jgi:hypothetical protein
LKTPATHATQLETPMFPHFLPVFTCYTSWYKLLQTPSYLLHTQNIELNANHVP